jgi:hypothetical protein
MKKTTLILLIILLVYGNCKDAQETPSPNPSALPSLTLAGKSYMACLIDNVQWINSGSHVEPAGWGNVPIPNLEGAFKYFKKQDSTKVKIQGNMYTTQRDDDFSIEFLCKGFPNTMEVYSIDIPPKANLEFKLVPDGKGKSYRKYFGTYNNAYVSNPKLNNSANITFVKIDTIKKIISGVFFAKIFSNLNSTPKTITQGRFDLPYQPYPIER